MPQCSVHDVQAAAAGDLSAFETLVRATASTVCGIALAITGDVQASEDVSQEVFLKAWRALPQLRDPASFPGWLRQLARNRARQHVRSRTRRHQRVQPTAPAPVADPSGLAPDELLARREEDEAVQAALMALPDEAREVLVLYHREGRSTAQVAQLLELSEPAVRKRLSRARAALRDDVRERLGGWLERTRPGAALVAAVLAAAAGLPRAAYAARGWRWAGALAVGAMVLLGLGWWARPAPEPVPAPGAQVSPTVPSGPASTRRAQRLQPLPDEAREPDAAPADLREPVELVVPLGASGLGRNFVLAPGFQPSAWFPLPGEVPLPEGEATDALFALMDLEEAGQWAPEVHDPPLKRFLDAAEAEGWMDGTAEDGWGALITLEAQRRAEDLGFREQGGYRYRPDEPPIPRELDALAELVADLLEDPAHPIAGWAPLYELYVYGETGEVTHEDIDQVLALARHDDDLVAAAAANALPWLMMRVDRELTADELRTLRQRAERMDGHPGLADLAALGLQLAWERSSEAEVQAWHRLTKRALDDVCRIPGAAPSCEMYGKEAPVIFGQVAQRLGETPTTWQQGVVMTTLRCHGHSPLATDELAGEAEWTGGAWAWASWSTRSALADCIERQPVEAPRPPAGTRLRLVARPAFE
jgi:RNA polymerase sigma factor (sigma-70 family)